MAQSTNKINHIRINQTDIVEVLWPSKPTVSSKTEDWHVERKTSG